jgi:hypothetical protein
MTTFVRHETRRWRYFSFTKFKTVVDNERNRRFESVYSKKVRAGKRRTYFFDVRKTKGEDFYLTLTESTKRFNGEGYERHKIFLYKEDFNRFLEGLEEAVNYIKTELMPNYDYDEFARRHDEDDYEEDYSENNDRPATNTDKAKSALESDDDMSW